MGVLAIKHSSKSFVCTVHMQLNLVTVRKVHFLHLQVAYEPLPKQQSY